MKRSFIIRVCAVVIAITMTCMLSACRSKEPKSLEELVREAEFEYYHLYEGCGIEIEVVIFFNGEDTLALSTHYPTDPLHHVIDGHAYVHLWGFEGISGNPKPVLIGSGFMPLSPGLSIHVDEYKDGYVVYGGLSEYHWVPSDDSRIDISQRHHMVIQSQTGSVTVPADGLLFLAILDSDLQDILLLDENDNVLLSLSERKDELDVIYIPLFQQ